MGATPAAWSAFTGRQAFGKGLSGQIVSTLAGCVVMNAARRWRPRRSTSLSREEIVTCALALVRGEGLSALTMRRVADELGVAPMSLYRHIGDRQDLLVGMLDEVAKAVPRPQRRPDARAELRAIGMNMRDAFHRDPWVVLLLANDGLASELILPLIDQVFDCLFRLGLDTDSASLAWQVIFTFLYGEALATQNLGAPSYASGLMRDLDPRQLPALARVLAQARRTPDPRDDFATMLDRLLNGVLTA